MELADAYQAYLGKELSSILWRPITCDTPDLVKELQEPIICFSGAASLIFPETEMLSLTWKNESECYLGLMAENDWDLSALDLIHATSEEPWGSVLSGGLQKVSFYGHDTAPGKLIAIKHELVRDDKTSEFWIGVGRDRSMCESDDLVVCAGTAPANISELELLKSIES